MKILAVSDVSSPRYYEYFTPGSLDEFDLILACGDLKPVYLEFLVTMAHCPLVYVRGNHDDVFLKKPPEGCICAEDDVVTCQGLRILGLGGSYKYKDGDCMYTERQMRWRIWKLQGKLRRAGGFDILLTHAPARGINDFDNLPHRGFECFLDLIDKYRPKYFIHGHIHRSYGHDIPQRDTRNGTVIINAYDHCVIEL